MKHMNILIENKNGGKLMTEQRKKEERQVELCKDPDQAHSYEISRMIDETLKSHHDVWVTSDWHLWVRDKKDGKTCNKRGNFGEVLENYKTTVKPDDLVIHLGDLVDGEFKDKDQIKTVFAGLVGKKVLVRGNNDIFDFQFYKSLGFQYVVRSFIWNNILFSHFPVRNNNRMNIHGHIHCGYEKAVNGKHDAQYWIPYTNQIDVFRIDRKPQKLFDIIKMQPEYSKHVRECPEHFNEAYSENFFENVMRDIFVNTDPCDD